MSFADTYDELSLKLGACPIEVGVIGELADNECPHGRLPSDSTPECGCFGRPRAITSADVVELEIGGGLNTAQELVLDDLLEREAA